MASGKQPEAIGLAKDVARYVQRRIVDLDLSYDDVAKAIQMSKTYTAKRITGEMVFTLRDFELLAAMFELEPEELLARIQLPEASEYEGRLVPRYEVISRRGEKSVYRVQDADPEGLDRNIIRGRFGADVGTPTEDDLDAVARPTDPEPTDEQ